MAGDGFALYLFAVMTDVAILAGVPLAAATAVGLIVSVFQAITQIQDQTLAQTVKIAAIAVILLGSGALLTGPLLEDTVTIFDEFHRIAR